MPRRQKSKTPKQRLHDCHESQTDLSTGQKRRRNDTGESLQHHQSANDQNISDDSQEGSLEQALSYFETADGRVRLRCNSVLKKHLEAVESTAVEQGLPPEGFEILLKAALSDKFADRVNTRLMKSLIPVSVIPENSVVSAVSLLCVGKCSQSIQVFFLRWLITMFNFVDQKEQINALYGFFFHFLRDEKMCPYICHLLCLMTRKENVKPFRVKILLDLQERMGMQPHLQALLSLYKHFCPERLTLTLPERRKTWFRNADSPWTAALPAVRQRNKGASPLIQAIFLGASQPPSRKRKWNTQFFIPASSPITINLEVDRKKNRVYLGSTDDFFPVEQLQTFPQLLQNIHRLQPPSQVGSVLTNPLLLHYLNCLNDESVNQRLYYWMGQMLRTECPWTVVEHSDEGEYRHFLATVYNAECFLLEGFRASEEFLYKTLPFWDGFSCRSDVFSLMSWVPFSSFSDIKRYLYNPLANLFFTSSIYFKCSLLESLKELLQNWLSVNVVQVDTDFTSNTTLPGLVDMVAELVQYVGWISTMGLRLERNSTFLLYFILEFYGIVCDLYLMYHLPVLMLPPAGVFYPALLSMDAVNLNQLCYIMYRYRANLVSARENELSREYIGKFEFNKQTFREFNQYIIAMVGCLWTSKAFQEDTHHQGLGMSDELLNKTAVKEAKNSFNIVYHPALMGYSVEFLQQVCLDTTFNFKSIKGKKWDEYLEYLSNHGLKGLKDFLDSSVSRVSRASHNTAEKTEP